MDPVIKIERMEKHDEIPSKTVLKLFCNQRLPLPKGIEERLNIDGTISLDALSDGASSLGVELRTDDRKHLDVPIIGMYQREGLYLELIGYAVSAGK